MAELLEMITVIGPAMFILALFASAGVAIWLIKDLTARHQQQNRYAENNFLFIKRNSDRVRKVRYH